MLKVDVFPSGRLGNQIFQAIFTNIFLVNLRNQGIDFSSRWHYGDSCYSELEELGISLPPRLPSTLIEKLINRKSKSMASRNLVERGIYSGLKKIEDFSFLGQVNRKNGILISDSEFQIIDIITSELKIKMSQHVRISGYFENYLVAKEASDLGLLQPIENNIFGNTSIDLNHIGVHYRLGDTLDPLYTKKYGRADKQYFAAAIEQLGLDSSLPIKLFSDDYDLASELLRKLVGKKRIILPENSQNRVTDFRSMAQCGYLITSRSSFSWWAGVFSNRRGGVVIAPHCTSTKFVGNEKMLNPNFHSIKTNLL